MRKTIVSAGTAALLAAGLLLLPACQNDTLPRDATGGAVAITVSLTLYGAEPIAPAAGLGLGRTIFPGGGTAPVFTQYRLVVYDNGVEVDSALSDDGNFQLFGLSAGIYRLVVTAYMGPDSARVAVARGEALNVSVAVGQTNPVTIALSPIPGGPGGTFEWDFTFGGSVADATMSIANLVDGTVVYGAIDVFANGGSGTQPLDAGLYRVILTKSSADGDGTPLSRILHVFPDQASLWTETFDNVTRDLVHFALDAWDGAEWAFDNAINGRFFYRQLGIAGVYDAGGDYMFVDDIVDLFNELTLNAPGLPIVPSDPDELKALVDAALIRLAIDDGHAFLGVSPGQRESDTAALAQNGTAVMSGDWGGSTATVSVQIGHYTVEISFTYIGGLPVCGCFCGECSVTCGCLDPDDCLGPCGNYGCGCGAECACAINNCACTADDCLGPCGTYGCGCGDCNATCDPCSAPCTCDD